MRFPDDASVVCSSRTWRLLMVWLSGRQRLQAGFRPIVNVLFWSDAEEGNSIRHCWGFPLLWSFAQDISEEKKGKKDNKEIDSNAYWLSRVWKGWLRHFKEVNLHHWMILFQLGDKKRRFAAIKSRVNPPQPISKYKQVHSHYILLQSLYFIEQENFNILHDLGHLGKFVHYCDEGLLQAGFDLKGFTRENRRKPRSNRVCTQ